MPRTGPCGSVGSSSSLGGSVVQRPRSRRARAARSRTRSRPAPAGASPAASCHRRPRRAPTVCAAPAAAPTADRSAAWTCTTWSSCEQATKTLASSALDQHADRLRAHERVVQHGSRRSVERVEVARTLAGDEERVARSSRAPARAGRPPAVAAGAVDRDRSSPPASTSCRIARVARSSTLTLSASGCTT